MMTVDDALKLADDVENHGDKRSNSLSGQALAALAGEVRRLRADGYRRGMEDMREKAAVILDNRADATGENFVWHACKELANKIRAIKTEGEL